MPDADTVAQAAAATLRAGAAERRRYTARRRARLAGISPPRAGFVLSPASRIRHAHPRTRKVTLMPKDVILTPDGLEKLKSELEYLSTEKRREVAARIKEAREFGDISENAEYDDAKNEQAMLESKIAQLEEKLRAATVIDARSVGTDVVSIGTTVHVKDQGTSRSETYTIVGSSEANPAERKLSNESPVGKALIGAKRNEIVAVVLPNGKRRELKITKIDVGLK
jgi:transcription elongation factor GreA